MFKEKAPPLHGVFPAPQGYPSAHDGAGNDERHDAIGVKMRWENRSWRIRDDEADVAPWFTRDLLPDKTTPRWDRGLLGGAGVVNDRRCTPFVSLGQPYPA